MTRAYRNRLLMISYRSISQPYRTQVHLGLRRRHRRRLPAGDGEATRAAERYEGTGGTVDKEYCSVID